MGFTNFKSTELNSGYVEITGCSLADYITELMKSNHIADETIKKFFVYFQINSGIDLNNITEFSRDPNFERILCIYNGQNVTFSLSIRDMYSKGFETSNISCSYKNQLNFTETFQFKMDDTFSLRSTASVVPHDNGRELNTGGYFDFSGHITDDLNIDNTRTAKNPYNGESITPPVYNFGGIITSINKNGSVHDASNWQFVEDSFYCSSLDELTAKKQEFFDNIKSNNETLENQGRDSR